MSTSSLIKFNSGYLSPSYFLLLLHLRLFDYMYLNLQSHHGAIQLNYVEIIYQVLKTMQVHCRARMGRLSLKYFVHPMQN